MNHLTLPWTHLQHDMVEVNPLTLPWAHLQHDMVDGNLYFNGKGVPGLVLVQQEAVMHLKVRESGHTGAVLLSMAQRALVALLSVRQLRLHRLQLIPAHIARYACKYSGASLKAKDRLQSVNPL